MKIINFWVIRHGEKKLVENRLSEKGAKQVKETTQQLLHNINFQAAFHSEMEETKETVEIVLKTLGLTSKTTSYPLVMVEEGFGYKWAAKEQPLDSVIEKIIKERKRVTVADWLRVWPGALLIRGRMLGTMLGWARTLADQFPEEKEINVLVGSHSPAGELAAINLSTEALSYASLIQYIIEYDEETDLAKLVASCRIPDAKPQK